jgi:glutaredoxin
MPSFLEKVSKTLKKIPQCKLVLLVLSFTAIVYYLNLPAKEHFENGDSIIVTFYAFDYCGYCKKFQPTWEKVKNMNFQHNVEFRYFESNKMSDAEKKAVPHYVESSFAPNIIMTVNGKNIEFKQQSAPLSGLDEFIKSKGTRFFNPDSKHIV